MKVTGSKRRICMFGALTGNRRQTYKKTQKINSKEFIEFTKLILVKYKKIVYFIDRAPWHTSKITGEFFKKNKGRIKIIWFPVGFPEANPVEATWKSGKQSSKLGAKYHETFEEFSESLTEFYRTKKFNLNLCNYLCR
jgi:transposase